MLNLRITSHSTHEDYVAVQRDTGVLPISGRHFVGIISVCVISVICALPVGNLVPLSFEASPVIALLNRGTSQNNEQAYLQSDDAATAANLEMTADAGSSENYDDVDLPSALFSTQAVDDAVAAARRNGSDESVDAFDDSSFAGRDTPEIRQRFTPGLNSGDDNLLPMPAEETASLPQNPYKEPEFLMEKPAPAESSENSENAVLAHGDMLPPISPIIGFRPEHQPVILAPQVHSAQENRDLADTAIEVLAHGTLPQISALQSSAAASQPRPEGTWYSQTVRRGDTISGIFDHLSLPDGTLAAVRKAAEKGDLKLQIGQQIHFLIVPKNNVLELVKPVSKTEQVRLTRMSSAEAFIAVHEPINAHVEDKDQIAAFATADKMPSAIEAEQERKAAAEEAAKQKALDEKTARENARNRPRLVVATLAKGESFQKVAKRLGLTQSNISQLTSAVSGKVNLKRMGAGDSFRVLFSAVGPSAKITAVEFNTARNGKVRLFCNPVNNNFYEEDGYKPVTGVFRRFPVNGNLQVSSPFNPRRYHPIRHRTVPHNGVDFRMPVGTPVYSPADGVVTYAGYMRGGGYTVIIKHMGVYSTVYMHLSRMNVSKGDTVRMGQLIAKSGNTGSSTGSHLHYEIRVNDRPVDPLKVDLPSGSPQLARQRREKFTSTVKILKSELYQESLAVRR